MSKLSPQIADISGKIDQLKLRLDNNLEEKATLQKMIGELSDKLDQTQQNIEELKEENGKLRMASSLAGASGDKKEVKLKINELVREIDKCIALLNG